MDNLREYSREVYGGDGKGRAISRHSEREYEILLNGEPNGLFVCLDRVLSADPSYFIATGPYSESREHRDINRQIANFDAQNAQSWSAAEASLDRAVGKLLIDLVEEDDGPSP
jgi:hypothetical protein